MNQNRIIGAIEIGTATVTVLVGEIVGGRRLNIIGMGVSSSRGVKKGEIVDFKAASDCTHAAIMTAEKSAGAQIECAYLSQTGRHLKGFRNTASINVSGSDNRVSRHDIERAERECKAKQLPPGRLYIHHIQNPSVVDGRSAANPLHMDGRKLELAYWSIHGDEAKVGDHIHVINGFGLNVGDMILSSIASGAMVVDEVEKENGVLVLDIGCGTTDYVLYHDGFVIQTGVIPVGGDHLTNDLSLGLRVNRRLAEKHKIEHGAARVRREDKHEKVWLVGDQQIGDRQAPKSAIYQILNARVDELFKLVGEELGGLLTQQNLPAGIVLTGGTARLPGIDEAARERLKVDVRVGENPSWVRGDLRKPEFSTTLGLLHYALTGQEEGLDEAPAQQGLLRKMARMFTLN